MPASGRSTAAGTSCRCGSITRTPISRGIVYYANYLRFLERGRTELLRLLGLEPRRLRAGRGGSFVVRRCTVDYLQPARLDETIDVDTRCGELRGASLEMLQEARRGDELLVRAELLVACMSDAGRPMRIPADARAALDAVAVPVESPRSRHIRI